MTMGLLIYLQGYAFTWWKSLGSDGAVEEKLDNAMVVREWLNNFPNNMLRNLVAGSSDHYPILLETKLRNFVFK